MSSVKLVNISKQFDDSGFAVRSVNIKIEQGELAILVGPSGCGKSTILRMIAGLEEQSSGDVFIGERSVNDLPPRQRDIAMVFQDYALYPHMNVYQNLAFGLKLRQFGKAEIEERVREAAGILGIDELLQRKPSALSGGQRQRVALGRAIVRQPEVFLFDEPLSNLDAKLRTQMRTEISRLHQKLEATMIYVTHDQVEAMTMGDRIIVINQGSVQQVDTPLAVYRRPANLFTAGFIGSPAMNFLPGRMEAGTYFSESLEIPFDQLKGETRATVTLGVRPEHLRLEAAANAIVLPVVLEVVEQLGNESLLYFQLEGRQWIARVSSNDDFQPASTLELHLHPEDLHLFADAERDFRSIIVEPA